MRSKYSFLAIILCVFMVISLLPPKVSAGKTEILQLPLSTDAERENTASALKAEIMALPDGKNRNGRVDLTGFTQSADGTTDMLNIRGRHYLIRKQGDTFYALNGGWTGNDADLPSAEVVASDTTNFFYITSGISTSMLFELSPAGTAANGMPAYKIRFGNGNNLAVGSKIAGTSNLYYVKSTVPTSADKVRLEHSDKSTYFGIRNLAGTHGLRMNGTDRSWRWKDNSTGDNNYEGLGLMLYRFWSTQDLRGALNEIGSLLDAPAFYAPADYDAFLACVRESIDLFNKYNVVPKTLIEPYDYIQNRLDKQASALRNYIDTLRFTIQGLPQAETTAQTVLYQLPCKQPGVEDNMSYIIKTRKGKIIIIDGGWQGEDYDGKYLFSYLREITGDNTPHVDAWFFTHAHVDHYGAAVTIANLYADKITVDAYYQHNLTDEEVDEYFYALDPVGTKSEMKRINITFRERIKDSKGGRPKHIVVNSIQSGKCNSSFDFDEVHIDILQTFDDVKALVDSSSNRYTGTYENQGSKFEDLTLKELLSDNLNDTSIIFRVTVGGKSILFTGDCGFVGTTVLLQNHKRNQNDPEKYFNLKSDYVQVSHHGVAGLTKQAYQTIDADYALWPTGEVPWHASEEDNPWVYNCKQWFNEMGTTSYVAYAGPQLFRFPVIRSNKAVGIPAAIRAYVFDAKYYADNNADLKKAYGYDETKLYWHFVNFGIEEGRCASPFFDVKFYMNQNGQNFLYTYKGDYEKAFKHFTSNYNSTKLMKLSPTFDASAYASIYPQLAEQGIDTQFELLKHYVEKNYPRGIIATTTYPSSDGAMHLNCKVTQAKAPTCSAEGRTAQVKCTDCLEVLLESEPLAMIPHSYGEGKVTVAPTCNAKGVMTFYCDNCTSTKTEVIPAKGHSYTYTEVDRGSHMVGCENCDLSETASHNYENGTCACGAKEIKEPVLEPTWKMGHTLNLAGDISVKLAISKSLLAGFDMETVYVLAEMDTYEGNTPTGTEAVKLLPAEQGNYYYFTLTGLTAVHMNDRIRSVLYGTKDGQIYCSATDDYSITDYAYAQLNKAGMPDTLKTLCADLLRYGAKAQIFKSYRTDTLADSAMTESHKTYLSDMDTVTFGDTNTVLNDHQGATVTWTGKALDLASKVTVKFIFSIATNDVAVEDLRLHLTFTDVRGKTKTEILTGAELYNAKHGFYAFSFDGLLAAELRTVISAQVYQGDAPVSCTLQYSADTYAKGKTGTLGDLCKALFAYSDSAKAYFAG